MKCPKCQIDNPDTQHFCGECGTPLIPSGEALLTQTKVIDTSIDKLSTGAIFAGRYQIIEEIGKGGMGRVYKVLDKKLDEEIALKLIKSEIASDKKTVERFSNELKIARKIGHKNVARMFDLNEEHGTHYITMEYVQGEDLKRLTRKLGQFSAGQAIPLAKQICEGLAEAHRLGIVHRDLKPQNVIVDEDGNARIMDFGIALTRKTKGITGSGVMIGTPEYMSPEQVEGKDVDQRSDIYSLGVILYEMMTGHLPFEGDTALSVAVKHKTEAPRAPKQLNPLISEDLNRVILRCMEKDKENRYQSTGEVRSELDMIEKGLPTTEKKLPSRKPFTSKEITVTIGMKKLLIPALVVIAFIIAAVVIWKILPQKGDILTAPSDKPSLAVVYFENNTGDENLGHWRKGLSELLITDLAQSRYFRVMSGDKIFNILREMNLLEADSYSSEDLERVAARGGATHILRGGYTKAADTFRINMMLLDTKTGEPVGSEKVEGKGEESIFSMVDELTKRIKANLQLSAEEISSDLDAGVGMITTGFPEAYKFYSEGRRLINIGEDQQSIQLMEKAIAVDPEFAMAFRSMAMSYSNLGYFNEFREYVQRAFELSDRLSEKELYIIQGDFYRLSEKTYGQSLEAYKKLLELYPEDTIGNVNLALLYGELEEADKAIERYEVLIQAEDETYFPYANSAMAYCAKGLYDKAEEVLEYYIHNFSENFIVHSYLGDTYLFQGKYDLALAEAEKSFFLNPTDYMYLTQRGDVYHLRGDLEKADEEYRKHFDLDDKIARLTGFWRLSSLALSRGRFEETKGLAKQGAELAEKMGQKNWERGSRRFLAHAHLRSENPEEALKELEKVWDISVEMDRLNWQRQTLEDKGMAYLEMKSVGQAQKKADELKMMVEEALNKKQIRLYYLLMGRIELGKENHSQAIDYFKDAFALMPYQFSALNRHAQFIDPLALAYYRAGDLENAKKEYERITSLTVGRLNFGDIYVKSFYMLGKICEQQSDTAKAIEHYEKFLILWKDADPGIPEVDDAKARLATLQNH